MCESDLDSILSHLSTKVNRIFCDREFVGCVKEDLDVLITNTDNKCCVLFPKLKPNFLKVLRYQAEIFGLSVFYVGHGPKQIAVVCRKQFLKNTGEEIPEEQVPKSMDTVKKLPRNPPKKTCKSTRPTQPYYVPPAQRTAVQKNHSDSTKLASKKIASQSMLKRKEGRKLTDDSVNSCDKMLEDKISKNNTNLVYNIKETCNFNESTNENESVECSATSKPLPLNNCGEDSVNSKRHSFDFISECNADNDKTEPQILSESDVGFDKPNESLVGVSIAVADDAREKSVLCVTESVSTVPNPDNNSSSTKLYNVKLDLQNLDTTIDGFLQEPANKPKTFVENNVDKTTQKYENNLSLENSEDINKITNILKSILIEQTTIPNLEIPVSEEQLNKNTSEEEVCLNLQIPCNGNSTENNEVPSSDIDILKSNTVDINNGINTTEEPKEPCESHTSGVLDKSSSAEDKTLYISYCDDNGVKQKSIDCDIDNEKEEMLRAIENMNRKTRPIIKHIRQDNTLRIDDSKTPLFTIACENKKPLKSKCAEDVKDNSVSSWEDMFDEQGDLQPEHVEEIIERIGCDVKVVKASHDYSAYQNAKYRDLEHVIELYDFPSSFKTQDLIQLYKGAYQDPMYIKWCDDTHALLVSSSPCQAQRALKIEHDMIKSRPLTEASAIAAATASTSDLKPAMRRPQTNMQTARRLINTHLGTKSTLSKEEVELERQALRFAREQRRQERQNEKDAWEGRPHNTKQNL